MNTKINITIEKMKQENINQLLVCDPGAIYYLTGHMFSTGHRMLVLLLDTTKKPVLFIHEMFNADALEGVELAYWKDTDNYLKDLYDRLDKTQQVAVDKELVARFLIPLQDMGLDLPLKLGSYIIDDIRAIKSDEEIELMKKASEINDTVMIALQDYISNSSDVLTEAHLEEVLSELFQQHGGDRLSFSPIIGFGKNAADPHHEIDHTVLQKGDCIVLDIGCVKDNYCSDMTRTVFYKEASQEHAAIYEIVKEANLRATAAVKPGVKCSEIDAVARDYITEKGYGEYFFHRLGHFIGTEVHEAGDISASNHSTVKPGMIFSIEPGIYIYEQNIGVRVENLVLVTETGCESLNKIPVDLKII